MKYLLIYLLMLTSCFEMNRIGRCYIAWDREDSSYVQIESISPNGDTIKFRHYNDQHKKLMSGLLFTKTFLENYIPTECPKETK